MSNLKENEYFLKEELVEAMETDSILIINLLQFTMKGT